MTSDTTAEAPAAAEAPGVTEAPGAAATPADRPDQAADPTSGHPGPGTAAPAAREPLGRRFAAAITSTALANLADGIVQVGLPLYAITLTRSPFQVALLTAAAWLPWLLLAIAGGLLVDRTDRRHVQTAGLLVRALALGGAAVVIATGNMTMSLLVALALLYGATDVVVDLAQNALVPDLVPRSRLQAANGRMMAVQQVSAAFLGAPLAGLLLTLGASWMVAAAAGLAAAAVLALLGVRGRYKHAANAERATRGIAGAWHDVREGLGTLVRHPVLRPMTIAASVANMANTAYSALLVLWAVGEGSAMGLTAAQFTWFGVAMALGAIAGSVLVEQLVTRLGELPVVLGGWFLGAVTMGVPVLFPAGWVLYPVALALGLTMTASNVVSQSLRQRLVPARLLGRVSGGARTLSYGLMPLGALLGGAAANHWGLAPVMTAACAVAVVAPLLPALTVRRSMLVEAPREDADADALSPAGRAG